MSADPRPSSSSSSIIGGLGPAYGLELPDQFKKPVSFSEPSGKKALETRLESMTVSKVQNFLEETVASIMVSAFGNATRSSSSFGGEAVVGQSFSDTEKSVEYHLRALGKRIVSTVCSEAASLINLSSEGTDYLVMAQELRVAKFHLSLAKTKIMEVNGDLQKKQLEIDLLSGQIERRNKFIRDQRSAYLHELRLLREQLFLRLDPAYLPSDFVLRDWTRPFDSGDQPPDEKEGQIGAGSKWKAAFTRVRAEQDDQKQKQLDAKEVEIANLKEAIFQMRKDSTEEKKSIEQSAKQIAEWHIADLQSHIQKLTTTLDQKEHTIETMQARIEQAEKDKREAEESRQEAVRQTRKIQSDRGDELERRMSEAAQKASEEAAKQQQLKLEMEQEEKEQEEEKEREKNEGKGMVTLARNQSDSEASSDDGRSDSTRSFSSKSKRHSRQNLLEGPEEMVSLQKEISRKDKKIQKLEEEIEELKSSCETLHKQLLQYHEDPTSVNSLSGLLKSPIGVSVRSSEISPNSGGGVGGEIRLNSASSVPVSGVPPIGGVSTSQDGGAFLTSIRAASASSRPSTSSTTVRPGYHINSSSLGWNQDGGVGVGVGDVGVDHRDRDRAEIGGVGSGALPPSGLSVSVPTIKLKDRPSSSSHSTVQVVRTSTANRDVFIAPEFLELFFCLQRTVETIKAKQAECQIESWSMLTSGLQSLHATRHTEKTIRDLKLKLPLAFSDDQKESYLMHKLEALERREHSHYMRWQTSNSKREKLKCEISDLWKDVLSQSSALVACAPSSGVDVMTLPDDVRQQYSGSQRPSPPKSERRNGPPSARLHRKSSDMFDHFEPWTPAKRNSTIPSPTPMNKGGVDKVLDISIDQEPVEPTPRTSSLKSIVSQKKSSIHQQVISSIKVQPPTPQAAQSTAAESSTTLPTIPPRPTLVSPRPATMTTKTGRVPSAPQPHRPDPTPRGTRANERVSSSPAGISAWTRRKSADNSFVRLHETASQELMFASHVSRLMGQNVDKGILMKALEK